ncbi:AAA family ATPase [Devosia naphthalenivorans]|uniref:AAA family ATPase n=1 Tax=Devosia naphthalenivorans TaxID=2082392 RepID=UPI000D332D1B|nr:AAA family ATPase [Devosia naphthalenivorans]
MPSFDSEHQDFAPDATLPNPETPPEMDARRSLVTAALMGVNTIAVRRCLASSVPHVIIINTPSHAWSRALAAEIGQAYDNVSSTAVVENKKDSNQWTIDTMLQRIGIGQHQVFCTADASTLLPSLIHAAADVRLTLPAVDTRLLQRAISSFTGKSVRGMIDADMAGLDFPVLQLAMRPDSNARDCLLRLRRSADQAVSLRPGAKSQKGPALEDLPLGTDVAAWAYDMLGQLKDVTAGALAPDDLRHGVLAGEPGTGKTLVAGALAKSAGWSFHSASIGAWFNSSDGNLGGVSKSCVAFFDTLLAGDCVVGFLDEADSLPSRANLEPRDLQWWGTLINLMLTQIDRVRNSGKRVLLLAATNYYDRLDPALVRDGRLEQRVIVRAPRTEEEVFAIFAHYLKGEIDPAELAGIERFALGATPAMIAGWIRTARAEARSQDRALLAEDVVGAVVPSDTRSPEELLAVAVHEAGHAVVARALGIGVEAVSILSRGIAGGVTKTSNPSPFPNRDELEDMVTVLLGGRAADLVIGNKGAHAGAALDLEMATSLLVRGHCQLGLYDTLGAMVPEGGDAFQQVDKGLKRLLARAVRLVTENTAAVNSLAEALIERRLLSGAQLEAVIEPLLTSASAGAVATAKSGVVRAKKAKSQKSPNVVAQGEAPNGRLA